MAALIHSYFPVYNDVANYTGTGTAIRSAGIVGNAEQAATIAALQHGGGLPLSQFSLTKLPRNVLFLETEKSAKVKTSREGGEVTSTSQSDLDEDRALNKVQGNVYAFPRGLEAIDADDKREKEDEESKDKTDFAVGLKATPELTGKDNALSPAKALSLPSVLGRGSGVYQGVATASGAALAGRNLSVLA